MELNSSCQSLLLHPCYHQAIYYCACIIRSRFKKKNKLVAWQLYCSKQRKHEKHVWDGNSLNRNLTNLESTVCEKTAVPYLFLLKLQSVWRLKFSVLHSSLLSISLSFLFLFFNFLFFNDPLLFHLVIVMFIKWPRVTKMLASNKIIFPSPTLLRVQFITLQKHGAGLHIKHSPQTSTES